MDPLELTIYPFQNEQYPSGYRIKRDGFITRIGATRRAEPKHLTDAELAAEWWRSERDLTIHWYDAMACSYLTRECATLLRFATHPHYYEETE